ncbi:Retrograde regulation protein 2 [Trichophyton interdigitale]|uniref:Retrograde regulation protein 2 n=1 Tax=Trichophyton interdigitale TaxID=101480 RepID=A0A9P4YH82_9EURO|nr:Retrograde regulation protein 2 [Trichophyton interdigitale]KAF3899798.1 Retrograde regulation protein 2 [Trichophyton interdigitale]KAG8211893.1 Retrograde regulation protein 2 [Trichophyton interdigitale]
MASAALKTIDTRETQHLHAVVDMGSNGIRFSISDLSPVTQRIMPTVFQDRAGISLYDAQFGAEGGARRPIPDQVRDQIVSRLLRFKVTCEDFGVPEKNIQVLATEATRTAPNSADFRAAIYRATGWEVTMLPKEEEGRIGGLGIASSLCRVEGLVMDLGGGSVQLSWMISTPESNEIQSYPGGSISFPYGAAALTRRLDEAQRIGDEAVRQLKDEMLGCFRGAVSALDLPACLQERVEGDAAGSGGLDLYLSGGGFRGWGYLLLSQSPVSPYPIPILNGFSTDRSRFLDTSAAIGTLSSESTIYGVSARRATQVPAVAFLINVLAESIPSIRKIHFCQGGVREGVLFDTLPPEVRQQHPLIAATAPFKTGSASDIALLLRQAIPYADSNDATNLYAPPLTITSPGFIEALANSMYMHSSVPRASYASTALHSTTTGILAYAHGLSHADRAMLCLALFDRWAGDISPSDELFLQRIRSILTLQEAWWCQYIGRVAGLVGSMYPAGVIRSGNDRISFSARLSHRQTKKGLTKHLLHLVAKVPDTKHPSFDGDSVTAGLKRIKRTGKKGEHLRCDEYEQTDALDSEDEDWRLKVETELDCI